MNCSNILKPFGQQGLGLRVLVGVLCFQLATVPGFQYLARAQEDPPSYASNQEALEDLLPQGQTSSDSHLKRLQDFADSLDKNGKPPETSLEARDPFGLTGQRIEVPREHGQGRDVYDVSRYQVDLPVVPFSEISVQYDASNQELVFEAMRGEEVVGRQILSDWNISAIAIDRELVTFIDGEGKLNAIDMGYAAKKIFHGPIPVFKNLWEPRPGETLQTTHLQADYISRGVRPPDSIDDNTQAVIPRDHKGRETFQSGDMMVYWEEHGQRELMGIFSRQVIQQRIQQAVPVLQYLAFLTSPESVPQPLVKKIIERVAAQGLVEVTETKPEQMAAPVRDALLAIEGQQIEELEARYSANKELSERDFDKFNFEEWKQTFEAMQSQARREQQQTEKAAKDWLQDLQSQLENDDFSESLAQGQFVESKTSENVVEKIQLKRTRLRRYAAVLTGGAAAAALAGPLSHEAIQSLSWMYAHWYPPILKDFDFRVHGEYYLITLLKSSAALVALWPFAVMLGALTGPALKQIPDMFKKGSKARNIFLDLKKRWADLGPWQVIFSATMRVYARLIYPYFHPIFETVLRQPHFWPSVDEGINPFKSVDPSSSTGQQAGLNKREFVGVKNPLLGKKSSQKSDEIKHELRRVLTEQKQRRKALAWLLGTLAVSHESGVDPATLLHAMSGHVDSSKLRRILNDPEKKKNWLLTIRALEKHLTRMKALEDNVDISELDPRLIAQYYNKAKEVVRQVEGASKNKKAAQMLKLRFRETMKKGSHRLINLGEKESKFLKTIYANGFVADQVRKEFVTDHLMVVGIVALIGDRANPNKPGDLAAHPDGMLWTSGPHLYDLVLNTLAHFLVNGSNTAMVYQGEPQVVEDKYAPYENWSLEGEERQEGFFRGSALWFKNVLTFTESNLGGYFVKHVAKRMATIQAAFTLALVFRVLLTDQPPDMAIRAWILWTLAAEWYFGWMWQPIRRGNQMEGERIGKMKEKASEAKRKISQGLRGIGNAEQNVQEGMQEIIQLYKKHNPKALKDLETLLKEAGELKEGGVFKNAKHSEREAAYYGLLHRLGKALYENNQKEVTKVREQLSRVLARDHDLDISEIRELSAPALLEFSLSNPPHYTQANKMVSWLTVWGGAVGSTILAIPLMVKTFHPEALEAYDLAWWFVVSAGLYTTTYFTMGARPWKAYINKIQKIKDKVKTPAQGASDSQEKPKSVLGKAGAAGAACASYLKIRKSSGKD